MFAEEDDGPPPAPKDNFKNMLLALLLKSQG